MIHSRPRPSVVLCTVLLLAVALLASLLGLSHPAGGDTSTVTTLFYIFIGLFAVSFFFVLRSPRPRRR